MFNPLWGVQSKNAFACRSLGHISTICLTHIFFRNCNATHQTTVPWWYGAGARGTACIKVLSCCEACSSVSWSSNLYCPLMASTQTNTTDMLNITVNSTFCRRRIRANLVQKYESNSRRENSKRDTSASQDEGWFFFRPLAVD
jgi:hypothetical protein